MRERVRVVIKPQPLRRPQHVTGSPQTCCADIGAVIRAHLHDLAEFSIQRHFDRGEIVYQAGDPADSLFSIESGRVKLVRVSAEGREKVIEIVDPGDFFGEVCLCEVTSYPHSAVALEHASLTRYDVKAVHRLIARKPELTREFMQMVCTRLVGCQNQVADLTFDSVARRLARELLRLSRAASTESEDGLIRLSAPLTHEDLAGLVGSSREVVTSLMNQFRRSGLVEYSRWTIHVSPDALEGFVEGRLTVFPPRKFSP